MAESIIVHFKASEEAAAIACVNGVFGEPRDEVWRYPRDEYLVMASRYRDFLTEYDDEQRAAVRAALGCDVPVSFDFEIRRSRSDEACDFLERMLRGRFAPLEFVVDDMSRLVSSKELQGLAGFLDEYRYGA